MSPSVPYTEVDNLVLDVMGRESFKTNLINIGDTKQRAEKYDDPALLLLNHGQNLVSEVKHDRLHLTQVDIEDEELLGEVDDEEENEEIERYANNLSPEPQKSQVAIK